jgi:hypothetical protein
LGLFLTGKLAIGQIIKSQCEFQNFFQMDIGKYGHDDKFCGTRVPILRKNAKKYCGVSLDDMANLLQNELHEGRFVALVLLVEKFKSQPGEVLEIYLKNIRFINNWDLWMLLHIKFVKPIASTTTMLI